MNPKKFSDSAVQIRAKYKLTNLEMGAELGMNERQYIRYEKGEYDHKDIKPTLWASLKMLNDNGPQYVRKGEGGDRLSKLESDMRELMADMYLIKKKLGL